MIFAVLRHNHPPRYFPFRLLFPTIATPYHTMAPRADNKRQTRRKPAVTPTRVQPIRLGEASGQAALRPPPELTASVSGPSDPLGAKDFDVKQTQSTLPRSVERSLSTTTGAERGSRNHPSPKAIEPTVHTPQITVNMQAAGVAVENHTAGSSSKWAARSPPVELPAKRGRDISSLNPASTFGDPIKTEQKCAIENTINPKPLLESKQPDQPNVCGAGLQKERPQSTSTAHEKQIADPVSIANKTGDALSGANTDQASTESDPSAHLTRVISTSSAEGAVPDPVNDPPPPVPEGHKLVHIVRHCRTWHK